MFIVTATSKLTNTQYVWSKNGLWCHYFPGMNEYMWKLFKDRDVAETLKKLNQDSLDKIKIGEWHVDVETF